MKFYLPLLMVWAVTCAVSPLVAAEPAPKLADLNPLQVFAKNYCLDCHQANRAKGGFRMDELLAQPSVAGHEDPWTTVLERIASREMPPHDEDARPTENDYEAVTTFLRFELLKSEQLTAAARRVANT